VQRKRAKKRSLHEVNEHFEPVFNNEFTRVIVFQQLAKKRGGILPTMKEYSDEVTGGI